MHAIDNLLTEAEMEAFENVANNESTAPKKRKRKVKTVVKERDSGSDFEGDSEESDESDSLSESDESESDSASETESEDSDSEDSDSNSEESSSEAINVRKCAKKPRVAVVKKKRDAAEMNSSEVDEEDDAKSESSKSEEDAEELDAEFIQAERERVGQCLNVKRFVQFVTKLGVMEKSSYWEIRASRVLTTMIQVHRSNTYLTTSEMEEAGMLKHDNHQWANYKWLDLALNKLEDVCWPLHLKDRAKKLTQFFKFIRRRVHFRIRNLGGMRWRGFTFRKQAGKLGKKAIEVVAKNNKKK